MGTALALVLALGAEREGGERPGNLLLAEQRMGGWPVRLLCSRNARSQKTLVGHAQWETKQDTLP